MGFPPCPESLKAIAHYLKVADEHDNRDVVVSYWCRIHALEVGLKIAADRTPEVNKLLISIMEWLETTKAQQMSNEGISSKMCGQATVENYALKLFKYADEQDRAENYGKNVVKAFYTAGILMDVLTSFGELSEDIVEKRKYSKWKAAYIHNCLKSGEKPVPGPIENNEDDDFRLENTDSAQSLTPGFPGFPAFPNPAVNSGNIAGPTSWNMFPTPPAGPSIPYMPPPASSIPYNPPVGTPYSAPAPAVTPTSSGPESPMPGASIDPELITKAQKHCKWATSALNYDDVKNAIDNLQKALNLLQIGKESPE